MTAPLNTNLPEINSVSSLNNTELPGVSPKKQGRVSSLDDFKPNRLRSLLAGLSEFGNTTTQTIPIGPGFNVLQTNFGNAGQASLSDLKNQKNEFRLQSLDNLKQESLVQQAQLERLKLDARNRQAVNKIELEKRSQDEKDRRLVGELLGEIRSLNKVVESPFQLTGKETIPDLLQMREAGRQEVRNQKIQEAQSKIGDDELLEEHAIRIQRLQESSLQRFTKETRLQIARILQANPDLTDGELSQRVLGNNDIEKDVEPFIDRIFK